MSKPDYNSYRFGRFLLVVERRQLWDRDAVVPLGTRAFDLLQALIEQAGRLVSKSVLMDRLWGSIAVGDNTLQVHISTLRRALGDDADYIVTHQGQGYQFVAPVELLTAHPGSSAAPPDARPGNLPYAPTRLIGRDADLTAIQDHLVRSRLVTITGTGGIGKTRLALEAGRRIGAADAFPDGIWLVELAGLINPDLIASTIVTALGMRVPDFALVEALERRALLLILDNCEHLIEPVAALVQSIIDGTPGVAILATSREALRCAGETVYSLHPFTAAPPSVLRAAEARAFPAIEFFLERVAAADGHFDFDDAKAGLVATICRRLDGIALALELAATQVPLLGLDALAARLDKQFRQLAGGKRPALPRHRTMQAALDWSYDLLAPAEQLLLGRLAVFSGSFTLAAAESVAADAALPEWEIINPLTTLVAKSLLVLDATEREARYRLLETTRGYAREKLESSGEVAALRSRHAAYLAAAWAALHGRRDLMPEAEWLAISAYMLDDLRAALDWGFGPAGAVEPAMALAWATRPLWSSLALRGEGLRWAERALARCDAATPALTIAWLRHAVAELRDLVGLETSLVDARAAIELFRTVDEPIGLARALLSAAECLSLLGRFAEAEPLLLECFSLIKGKSLPLIEFSAAFRLGRIRAEAGEAEAAKAAFQRATSLAHSAGERRIELAMQANLAATMFAMGEFDEVVTACRAVIRQVAGTPDVTTLALALVNLTAALVMLGRIDEALTVARDAMPTLRAADLQLPMLDYLALRAALAGAIDDAARIAGHADWAAGQHRFDRQHDTKPVIDRLGALLAASLADDRRRALAAEGAALAEDAVIALALA